MAVSSYKDVSWGDEYVRTDKLNTMASNTRYLFERAPRLYYNAFGVRRDTGIKIACGVASIPPSKTAYAGITVNFGTFFTTGSRVVVATSISAGYQRKIIATLHGLSGPGYLPDHRGFHANVTTFEYAAKDNHVIRTAYLNWVAMGL